MAQNSGKIQRMTQRGEIEQAIAHLEGQRGALGEAVVKTAVAALREKLSALEATEAPASQRKQITVLFADVSGFTALAEKLDAEDVTALMNALWGQLDAVITAHGGLIDKHMGDAVMALWGAEQAREDDPERAIQAGLAIQQALQGWRPGGAAEGSELPGAAGAGANLALRIGINTGPALLGSIASTQEFTAMGDTVNLAARLQTLAPVGGVLISHDTYRHVRGLFEVQGLPPVEVKGKHELVQVYLVRQARPRAFRLTARGVEGVETRLIGRQQELETLQAAFCRVVEQGQAQCLTLTGEAGVGKSRLIYEFLVWLELQASAQRLTGRANQEMQHLPYGLLRDVLATHCQVQESDALEVVSAKLTQTLGGEAAAFIGQLLGYDFSASPHLRSVRDPQQLRDRALLYLSAYLRELTSRQPVVLLLEDLHWADDSSLEALRQVLPEAGALLTAGAARPALFERWPNWGDALPNYQRLDLQPLSRADSLRLVDEILQKAEAVPEQLRELVVGNAEGNPFYVEELVKMLIEDGVILRGAERWQVQTERLAEVRLPPTLTAVLQARFDGLPAAERAALQRAAVIGRTFWDEAVAFLATPQTQKQTLPQITMTLGALRGREMIFDQEPSTFAGTREFAFKHTLLRQATYESVLKRERRVYHARAAEWLTAYTGGRAAEFTGLIAEHLVLAGQTGQAATYLRRAGEQAAAQFANAEALNYLSRALELTAAPDRAGRYALLCARAQVYDLLGERAAQRRDLEELKLLAATLGKAQQAEAGLRLANYANLTGDYPAAAEAARGVAELLLADPEAAEQAAGPLARAYLERGRALWRQGQYEAARNQLTHALALAHSADSPQLEADCLRGLGNVAWYLREAAEARRYYQQALELCRRTEDRWGEGQTLNDLGNVLWNQGEAAGARQHYEQALQIYAAIGNRRGQGITLSNLGNVALRQGELDEARQHFERALRLCRETGERGGAGRALNNLASVALGAEEHAQARGYYEQALKLFQETGDRQAEGVTLANLGLVCHNLGDHRAAALYSQQAANQAKELGDRALQVDALTYLGQALAALGYLTEASQVYQQAVEAGLGPVPKEPPFPPRPQPYRPGAPSRRPDWRNKRK
jgi:class 3 adenylate cyclase/Tfp pilus assembly protein PilF